MKSIKPTEDWGPCKPLRVRAYVSQEIVLKQGAIALDSLLIYMRAKLLRLPPPSVQEAETGKIARIDIPVFKERVKTRFYYASIAYPKLVQHQTAYNRRRFPVHEAVHLTKMNRVDTASGMQRSYNIPFSTAFIESGYLEWFVFGQPDEIRRLLAMCRNLGCYHRLGYGKVDRWEVEKCEEWDGFPLVRDGIPLRPLPLDWPGVTSRKLGYATLFPPYYDQTREEPCLIP